ncbi:MAG: hypothetical protein JSU72_01915 [Deltaproteobacteria bacterium]|nr:MAG: hypothetical protein JSU72_01915 [Deltaproteobacteria bacterium]
MDIDTILQKLLKWLSDPKGRETVKTILFLIFPLILLFVIRNAARRRPTEKASSALEPKIRATTTDTMIATESVKQTMAKERKKIDRELQEVFGREESNLARTKKGMARSETTQTAPTVESKSSLDNSSLQEELLRLFTRRPR